MTVPKADDCATMIDTIARFLESAADPARGWVTPRDGAERLAALLLDAPPVADSPAAASTAAIGALAPIRSLRQLRQQEARPLLARYPLPAWAGCAEDHCRTIQHCVHEYDAGRAVTAAARGADCAVSQAPAAGVPAPGKVELTPAN